MGLQGGSQRPPAIPPVPRPQGGARAPDLLWTWRLHTRQEEDQALISPLSPPLHDQAGRGVLAIACPVPSAPSLARDRSAGAGRRVGDSSGGADLRPHLEESARAAGPRPALTGTAGTGLGFLVLSASLQVGGRRPAKPDSRPRETQILLGRWRRGRAAWRGAGTTVATPTSLPAPAAGSRGGAGPELENPAVTTPNL